MMTKAQENIFESMVLHDNACFLCGTSLGENRTREHVFPRWLQKKHNLWDQKLGLLNGTFIRYNQLTVPCCSKCNNEHLSQLESVVENAFREGYDAVKELPSLVLYQWAGKIFYGILRKELRLYADLKDKNAGTIIPNDLIEGFSSLHIFLQSIRRPFVFRDGEHFSSLVVNLHYGEELGSYDFRDNPHLMVVGLRSNGVGVIIALQDARLISDTYGRYVADVDGRKLVPIQFDELFARVYYQISLLTRVPKFMTAAHEDEGRPVDVYMMPLAGLSSVPVVAEWNQEHYAHCLAAVLSRSQPHFTIEQLHVPPDQVMTWMNTPDGKLTFFNPDGSTQ